ncbi:DUF2147 domain-containing protein [Microbulbifer hydrolyticus]|uniref:DUF2147 domain-containing protein n=1 Tax=Microbulbifer hydrolyticus TaxID=48074 RepID=A0A6P1TES3_9GAMM|nr:DUF2147 domain-containing protein [Microbulbifer hydrolyticus]MBB5212535.1 uncharacterized protein (DUF2147 family) [Microbulbifer hydrolyticus]QHQ40156.1 DUF2147 domain-containing protein [Microbulbifer hydrolyticus]
MKTLLIAFTSLLFTTQLAFADVVGRWKTIDDETGQAKSIVEIYEQDGKYFGRVVDLLMKPDDTVCDACPGDKKGKKIVGMNIVTNMVKKGDVYEGGQILDPTKGKVYDCKMWEENGNLMVRGYLGFFYRTQTWYPAK